MSDKSKTTEGLTLLRDALDQTEELVDRYDLHQYVGDSLGELWTLIDQEIDNPCIVGGVRVPLRTLY
jgi:hypothetical protein